MLDPIKFETAVIGVRADGALSIALLRFLPEPHDMELTCVALVECSPEAATAMCEGVSSALFTDGTRR